MSSAEHAEFIERHVPRRGHVWVARQLGLKPGTVWAFADHRGLRVGDLPGWLPLAEVSAAACTSHANTYADALVAGVLRRLGDPTGSRAVRCVVPKAWAEAYIDRHLARVAVTELREEAGWLTTSEVAQQLGVGKSTVVRGANGRGVLGRMFEGLRIERMRGTGTGGIELIFEPRGVEAVRLRLVRDRHKAKTMVSTKSLAVEAGVKQAYAADLGRQFGGELLFVHGRLMCHVTHEVAELLRQRFRDHRTPGVRIGRPPKTRQVLP